MGYPMSVVDTQETASGRWAGGNPYRLISLGDMLKRYASIWIGFWLRLLGWCTQLEQHIESQRGLIGDRASVLLAVDIQSELAGFLGEALLHSGHLALEGCPRQIARLRSLVGPLEIYPDGTALWPEARALEVLQELRVLQGRIWDGLQERYFLFVPPDKAPLYAKTEGFGRTVAESFGKASFHISEASTCLALSRPTAAVYHSMCVLEVGLDSLAAEVGVQETQRNWQQIIHDISKKIDEIALGKRPGPPNWDKSWYSQVNLEFVHFKDAWGNHTRHGRAKYTESEAESIVGHVKAFMQRLAARGLRERS